MWGLGYGWDASCFSVSGKDEIESQEQGEYIVTYSWYLVTWINLRYHNFGQPLHGTLLVTNVLNHPFNFSEELVEDHNVWESVLSGGNKYKLNVESEISEEYLRNTFKVPFIWTDGWPMFVLEQTWQQATLSTVTSPVITLATH